VWLEENRQLAVVIHPGLLGCDAMWCCRWVHTWRWRHYLSPKRWCTYKSIRHHSSENQLAQLLCHVKLMSRADGHKKIGKLQLGLRFVEFYLNESTVWVTSSYLLRAICDWFSSSYLPRVYVVFLFFILLDLSITVVRRYALALSIGPNRVVFPFLPDVGDRLQSPKRRVFFGR
jgi:hypothetical protein